jgi:uncharacterized lipoprotein YehR (DUF1307 family)
MALGKIWVAIFTMVYVFSLTSCDHEQRSGKSKSGVWEPKLDQNKLDGYSSQDPRAKCADDARTWFNDYQPHEKNIELLKYIYHYKENKCFEMVFCNYKIGAGPAWIEDTSLWEVHENKQYGGLSERRVIEPNDDEPIKSRTEHCWVLDKSCTTQHEFFHLISPYLSENDSYH